MNSSNESSDGRPRTRAEAHAAYVAALGKCKSPADKTETIRRLARGDLFYLLVHVLRRDDVDRDWVYDRCREVEASPDGYLDLWAREHYKSSIITFGLTIQDILNDPEITVGIFSHTRPIAKGFLRQIKREFEANAVLKRLFPEILWAVPSRDAPKWSEDDGIIVRRQGNPKESTIEAWGLVDGQPTGKHFSLMVYDDVVRRESVTTPDMIRSVTDAWALSRNLTAEGGRTRYIGTRYHFNDTYGTMISRKSAVPRIYPATVDGTVGGEPVLFSRERLAEKRRDMGPYIFGCQMLLDPKADETQGFKDEWLAFWPAKQFENMNLYIVVDPASKKRKTSDYTFMAVVGLAEDENYYVVTMIRDRLNLTQRADALFALHREYRPVGVGYEEYGLQADIEHMEDRMNRENYRFPITPLGGKLKKEDRIRRLVPLFEQARVLLPDHCMKRPLEGVSEDLTKIFIDEEYLPFPVGAHDDMLDGLSRMVDPEFPTKFPGRPRHSQTHNPPRSDSGEYHPHSWAVAAFAVGLNIIAALIPGAALAAELIPGPVNARVVSVYDGDTLTVDAEPWLGLTARTRVRLAGVDTPEIQGMCRAEKDQAIEARDFVRATVGATVQLTNIRPGKYAGRVVADVWVRGRKLSDLLIAEGLGRPYHGGRRRGWCP